MIVVVVHYRCDWGTADKACDAVLEHSAPVGPGCQVQQPQAPSYWVRVDDRIYCPRHQVFIRPRDDDAPWGDARWVEEGLPPE